MALGKNEGSAWGLTVFKCCGNLPLITLAVRWRRVGRGSSSQGQSWEMRRTREALSTAAELHAVRARARWRGFFPAADSPAARPDCEDAALSVYGVSPGKRARGPEPVPDDGALSQRYSRARKTQLTFTESTQHACTASFTPAQATLRGSLRASILQMRKLRLKSNLLQDTQQLLWDGKWAHF